MIQLSVSEEPRQHSESARGEGLVDEGLLPIESFDCRAARQRVFAGLSIEKSLPFNDTGFGFCEEVGVSPATVSTGFVFKWTGGVQIYPTGCASALASSARRAAASAGAPARTAKDGARRREGFAGAPAMREPSNGPHIAIASSVLSSGSSQAASASALGRIAGIRLWTGATTSFGVVVTIVVL